MCARNRCIAFFLLFALVLPPGHGCGPWFPRQYLAQGGMSLLEAPRFFSEIELKLIAREYPVPFKAVIDDRPQARMRERDDQDFEAAIATGKVRPPDPEAARRAHRRMRETIAQYATLTPVERAALPPDVLDDVTGKVFPSEFADYQKGVMAYSIGAHAEARAAWERLMERPESERHYRSVRAAFMIGVLGVIEDWDETPRWLALARELAGRGFHDNAGLAAASFGWESQWHHGRGELREAAEDMLRGISAGYPGRGAIEPADESAAELAKFAVDPLLRRVHTSTLLARQTNPYNSTDEERGSLTSWLAAIEAVNVREFPGAERLGWLCYQAGRYKEASRWAARAPQNSSYALWLRGKLAARDGRKADALEALSRATRMLAREKEPALEVTNVTPDEQTPAEALLADHGIAAIGAAEFRNALDQFLQAGHWVDAAFVAERLMTTAELRKFLDSRNPSARLLQFRASPDKNAEDDACFRENIGNLRWLLARRLSRAGRFSEARAYYPEAWRPALDHYAQSLACGNSSRLSSDARALALWDAALETRYHGIELLGTETAPDWFARRGNYEEDDPASYRLGRAAVYEDRYASELKAVPLPAALRAGPAERARLQSSATAPEKRFHYRYRAADLAWSAAKQLPDNDPRLAEILNLAGRWLADRDPTAADRFYQALESRCAQSDIGARATAKRWFLNVPPTAVPGRPNPVLTEN